MCGKCSWSGGRNARIIHVVHVMPFPHKPLHIPIPRHQKNLVIVITPYDCTKAYQQSLSLEDSLSIVDKNGEQTVDKMVVVQVCCI
jgi:hypothetical protein